MVKLIHDVNPRKFMTLKGDFGRGILREYRDRVNKDYSANPNLDVLARVDEVFTGTDVLCGDRSFFKTDVVIYDGEDPHFSRDFIIGSNPFAAVLMDKILREGNFGYRIVNPRDIEDVVLSEPGEIDIIDSFLALRFERGPNEYLAKTLAKQITTRGKRVGKVPIAIPLRGLNLVIDANSPYGLNFELTEESSLISAPVLNPQDWFISYSFRDNFNRKITHYRGQFSTTDDNGLPILEREGERKFNICYSNGLTHYETFGFGTRKDDISIGYIESKSLSISGKRKKILIVNTNKK